MAIDEGKGNIEESGDLEHLLEQRESFGRLTELGFVRVDFPNDTAFYMIGNVDGEIVVYRHADPDAVTRDSLKAEFTLHTRMYPLDSPRAGVATDDGEEMSDADYDGEFDF